MKKILSYLIPALILVGIFGGIAIRLKKNKAIAQERVYHATDEKAMAPAAGKDAGQDAPISDGEMVFTGIFEPFRETKISAETQGKINRIEVDAGSMVSNGQKLIYLDDALLKLQLQAAEVQMEGLKADVNRYTILAKSDAVQGIQLEKAQLGLKSAEVQRATILEQIEKTVVKAPFNGWVLSKLNEIGGFAAPGVPLLHIIDIGRLKFTINVPENDLKYFKTGQLYEIVADAFPNRALSGRVSMIAGKANMGNSFTIQLTVLNTADYSLRAGMFGKLTLTPKN